MEISLAIYDISEKLSNTTENEKQDFKVSPSGYGIHWKLIDEDIFIKGLMRKFH